MARTGAQAFEGATPFVGRSVELGYLTALLDKAADSSSPQIALIVGEPGIGKTRLVAELFAHVDASPRLVTWRQGRCLSYGEGVTFWALAEIVKAHAGILESDDVETVEAKLEEVLPEGEDRPWFRQRLRALLGLEAAKAEREENFTAWLRFLEEIAAHGPTVLVLEDLHWADEALLDFLEFFALHVDARAAHDRRDGALRALRAASVVRWRGAHQPHRPGTALAGRDRGTRRLGAR